MSGVYIAHFLLTAWHGFFKMIVCQLLFIKTTIMKKLLCVSVILSLASFGYSQSSNVHFGLKAGVNVADLHASSGSFDSRTSFHLGGLAHIHLSKTWALQPELMYSGQGGKGQDGTLKLGYINVPVLAQYMVGDGFRLETGPQLGILASAKTENGNSEVDVKNSLETIDFGWVLGAGYIFPSGIGFDARYNIGVTNIRETTSPSYKNRVFQLGMFYQFK
jgi:hypothetical protein